MSWPRRGQFDKNDQDEISSKKHIKATKKSLKKRLIGYDKRLSWALVIVTLLTLFCGYSLTRLESQLFPAQIHIVLKVVFYVLLVYHAIIVTLLIRYRWKASLDRIIKKQASGTSLLKFTQRVTGTLCFCSAALMLITGLDYFCNFGEPFHCRSMCSSIFSCRFPLPSILQPEQRWP